MADEPPSPSTASNYDMTVVVNGEGGFYNGANGNNGASGIVNNVYTATLYNGYICKISGMTHTRSYARSFLRNTSSNQSTNPAKLTVEGLIVGRTYTYRVYQYAQSNRYATHTLKVNGTSWDGLDGDVSQRDNGHLYPNPSALGTAVANSNSKIEFVFNWESDAGSHHIQVSGLAIGLNAQVGRPGSAPVDVSLGIVSWYDGASFDTTNNKWVDKAGSFDLSSDYISGTISKKSLLFDSVLISNRNNKRYHQTKFPIYLSGNKNSGITFNKDASYQFLTDGSYTFFHAARRDPTDVNQTGRVFDGSGADWYSGFNDASSGVAKHENDSINTIDKEYGTNWVVSVDTPKYYRSVGYSDTSSGYYETSSGNRTDTNTTSPQISVHYGSNTFQGPIGSGGIITNYSNYSINTFLSSGTLSITRNTTADFLIVGGGGGGGGQTHNGGGGGAGGVVIATNQSLTAGSYNVVVGNGGDGDALSGSDSTFNGFVAKGGGGGGTGNYNVAINSTDVTGGTESQYSIGNVNYQVHSFTQTGNNTLTITKSVITDYMLVGGGGGGRGRHGGGGGAGGVIIGTSRTLPIGTYTINIGSGGQGGDYYDANNTIGYDGSNTEIVGNINLKAKGGGGGGVAASNQAFVNIVNGDFSDETTSNEINYNVGQTFKNGEWRWGSTSGSQDLRLIRYRQNDWKPIYPNATSNTDTNSDGGYYYAALIKSYTGYLEQQLTVIPGNTYNIKYWVGPRVNNNSAGTGSPPGSNQTVSGSANGCKIVLVEGSTETELGAQTRNSALGANQYYNQYRQFTLSFAPTISNPWIRFVQNHGSNGDAAVFFTNIELELTYEPPSNNGNDGGSGGGATYGNSVGNSKYYNILGEEIDLNGGSADISTNIIAYGNDGGSGQDNGRWPSGGGGGAGGVGGSPYDNQQSPGDGGIGIQNNFLTNNNIYYAGGGGASSKLTDTGGSSGGSGGGGDGKGIGSGNGGDATANTGGGGGGGGGDAYSGGDGGTGYAVFRFAYNDLAEKGDANIGGSGGGGGGNYLAGPTYPGGNDGTDGGSYSQDTYSSTTNVTGYGSAGGGFTGIPASEGDDAGGGGGGAGGVGDSRSPYGAGSGNGGIGIQNDFRTNSLVYYAGGGGGGSGSTSTPGTGGSSMGGSGSNSSSAPSLALANSGGGGGGGNSSVNGGTGASGIVVLRLTETLPAQQCDWNVGEVISYNRTLDITEENKVFDYLKNRYLGTGQSTTGQVYQLPGDVSGGVTIRGFPPEFPDTNNILGWYIPESYDVSGFWRDVSPFQNDLSSGGTAPEYVKNDKTYTTLSYLKGVKADSDNEIVASGYKFPEQFLPSDGSYTMIHVSRRISNTGRIIDSASNNNFYSGFVGNKSGVALHSIDVSSGGGSGSGSGGGISFTADDKTELQVEFIAGINSSSTQWTPAYYSSNNSNTTNTEVSRWTYSETDGYIQASNYGMKIEAYTNDRIMYTLDSTSGQALTYEIWIKVGDTSLWQGHSGHKWLISYETGWGPAIVLSDSRIRSNRVGTTPGNDGNDAGINDGEYGYSAWNNLFGENGTLSQSKDGWDHIIGYWHNGGGNGSYSGGLATNNPPNSNPGSRGVYFNTYNVWQDTRFPNFDTDNKQLVIGNYTSTSVNNGSHNTRGIAIYSFRVWHKKLTQELINKLYNAGHNGRVSSTLTD